MCANGLREIVRKSYMTVLDGLIPISASNIPKPFGRKVAVAEKLPVPAQTGHGCETASLETRVSVVAIPDLYRSWG